jgi:iron complex outermembrane recepter protein
VQPIIRGQTNLNGGAGDPNVAVFLDGIYISNNTAINLGLIQVARIEVVKGPVSALYGRNAFAGAINYVSQTPATDAPHASVSGFVGNDQQYSFQGAISYPIIPDVLAARITAGYEHFGGSYKDEVTGARAGGFEKRDLQASAIFTPTPELSVKGSYYYGRDTFGLSAIAYNVNNCGARNPASLTDPAGLGFTAFCGHFDPLRQSTEVPSAPSLSNASGNDRKVHLASLNISYDFGFATITSLTGYTKVTQQRFTDFIGRRNGIPFVLNPAPGAPAGAPLETANLLELFGSNSNNRDYSQEIRVQSDATKPFRFQFGGFYYKGRVFNTTIIGIDRAGIPAGRTIAASNGFGQAVDYLTTNGAFSTTRITQSLSHDRQLSGFVGLEYDVTEALTLSSEYRYTDQKKDQLIIRSTGCPATLTAPTATCTGPAPTPFLFPNGPVAPKAKFTFDNYRATAKYQVTEGINTYASIATGTKSGGFNQRATVPEDLSFDPEKNTTYELGLKSSFFDNRVQLNIAIYHIDTKGIQISGPSTNASNPGLVTKNFGSAKTDGFEIELAARVADGVRVNAGIGYSDPRFGSDAFDYAAGAACRNTAGVVLIPQCAGDVILAAPGAALNPSTAATNTTKSVLALKGNHLPRTSNLQLTGGLSLEGPISADWKWVANSNIRYESKQYAFNNNISTFGPRTVVNIRAGVESDTYSVTAYVNNLTNDRTPEIVSSNARLSDFVGEPSGYLPIGRQYGLTVGAKF